MPQDDSLIRESEPRQTVQVHLQDGRTFEGPRGTALAEFVKTAYPASLVPIMAAQVDSRLEELHWPVDRDVEVRLIDTYTSDGLRIYQRSVSLLLVVAAHELYPDADVLIDHSVPLGGFFCQVQGRAPFNQVELEAIEGRMRAMVEADEPIRKERFSLDDATRILAAQGYDDKVALFQFRQRDDIALYNLRGLWDYYYGYMAYSTGQLPLFALEPYPPDGFILRLPHQSDPTRLQPLKGQPRLTDVFREYGRWLEILEIDDVCALNRAVEDGRIREAILVSEAMHEKVISDIADTIVRRPGNRRLVLIAGPSSSGKTTFARRLAIQLQVNGLRPFALGLDDYFVDRDATPLDATGEPNFEALEAINLPLFNEQLKALMSGRAVRVPRFDFVTGTSVFGDEVQLPQGAVIIVEGIHGLNPELVADVSADTIFRIYISALTQLNIDHHNRIPTTDSRLLRRIVRDAHARGYQAQDTIERWESVRRGEERNIFPFQEHADIMFNSALAYELAVLKPFAEPLLLRVPRGTIASMEARRLLAFLQWVRPYDTALVPANSLLREFIGGSVLSEFSP
ncbi:MAG: uridine kinase family protein [Anaerolineae bacterium]